MNKKLIPATLAGLLLAGSLSAPAFSADPALDSQDAKVGYSMGLMFGKRMSSDLPDLNMETFISGLRDGLKGAEPKLSQQEMQQAMQAFQQEQRKKQMQQFEEQSKANLEKSKAFLEENAKQEGVKTTDSGLQYQVVEEGDGKSPGADDRVKVHYTGKLIDGTVFDSSRKRGEPVTFRLKDVIPGWTEGLQLMKEGGRMKLYLPPDLAYGPGGNRSIGPNEALIFDVELLEVNPEEGKGGEGE
ncbi:FKBP-type peptidyl-prolyl cis-trans isomerase [Marinobacteraceae bacterium S3BR75-40.1]